MPPTLEGFRRAVGALAAALPLRVMGEDDRRAMVAIYRDGVLAEAAATDDDLDRAVATLIRHSDWWPTLRQLLEAIRDVVDRRVRREVATQRPVSGRGDGMARAVASGEWDRAAARARVVSRLRRERHEVLLSAYWHDAGGVSRDRRKRLDAHLAVADLISAFWPEATEEQVDDELRTMREAGLLRQGPATNGGG